MSPEAPKGAKKALKPRAKHQKSAETHALNHIMKKDCCTQTRAHRALNCSAVPNPLPAQTRQRVVARAGETLDRVLRRTLSHLPIKDTVLRQAFVEVNPDVLTGSGAQRLKAGVELVVPNPEDVRRIMLREAGSSVAASAVKATPAADPPVPAPAPVAPAKSPSAEPPGPDMRDWVRYP